jgi:DNA-binding NarL/FixJ family response regulator
MEPTRVLLADDHPVFLGGMRALLDSTPGVEVVGEAATGEDAVTEATERQPDVVVMDIQMPGLNGIDATREIVARSPHVAVLILTMFEDDDSVFAAMRAGARGYLLKGSAPHDIVRAVETVGRGEAVFGPAIARRLIDFFAATTETYPFPELTQREREVLELLAQGRSNTDIARRFVISAKTVRNHVSNIFTKLHVADRAQAIVRAREAGLGQNRSRPG